MLSFVNLNPLLLQTNLSNELKETGSHCTDMLTSQPTFRVLRNAEKNGEDCYTVYNCIQISHVPGDTQKSIGL